ncbi:hypothetical protein [Clostridium lundense]|nr:hypothetical protein [Clostridium lundense]
MDVASLYPNFEEDGSIRAGSHRINGLTLEHRGDYVNNCLY